MRWDSDRIERSLNRRTLDQDLTDGFFFHLCFRRLIRHGRVGPRGGGRFGSPGGSPAARPDGARHRLTRLGMHFLFVGGFSMLGGAIKGLNLLLILSAGLIAALLVQWRWSRRSIDVLSLRRRVPAEAFAGRPFRVRFRLSNRGRILPVWLLRVDDEIRPASGGEGVTASTQVGFLPPRGSRSPSYDCRVLRRGRYRLGPCSVATSFPLALMSARVSVDAAEELDVYPRLLSLRRGWESRLLTRTEGATTSARRSGPAEGEFFGLREWQSGDHPRLIHWRTTARVGEPVVRQFEQQRRFDVCFLVDGVRTEDPSTVETAISLAATLLVRLVSTPSNRAVLSVAARVPEATIGGGSLEGKRRMLGMLARMQPVGEPDLVGALERAVAIGRRPRDLIVISPRPMAAVVRPRSDLARRLYPWTRTGTIRWLNVGDPAVLRGLAQERGQEPIHGTDPGGAYVG